MSFGFPGVDIIYDALERRDGSIDWEYESNWNGEIRDLNWLALLVESDPENRRGFPLVWWAYWVVNVLREERHT